MNSKDPVRHWYVARILIQCHCSDFDKGPWTVDEQIRMIRAGTAEQAYESACQLGRSEETEYISVENKNVRWVFIGLADLDRLDTDDIEDGMEITSMRHSIDDPHSLPKSKEQLAVFWLERNKERLASDILNESE